MHDGAEHDGMASGADADAEEQLRDAVNYQLEQYMQTSGEDLPPDAVAGLSDLLVDILGNGELASTFCCARRSFTSPLCALTHILLSSLLHSRSTATSHSSSSRSSMSA